ncbi:hypothetical protein MIND_01261100 [Mycena indigotica]|uniref:Uncharacterized protein n=1 Tax=Mycena indigotica TaxID=2126181 RepID=A0A8H6S1Y7_9AGAR|nr:uncharacterized protein MIND_01261100 [Mycena indigotica]KAF7291178.1 hypothetical protein MIND_01261100 [Mycena indigotica]
MLFSKSLASSQNHNPLSNSPLSQATTTSSATMWRVGALPANFAHGYAEVPGFVPPSKSKRRAAKASRDPSPNTRAKPVLTSLAASQTTLSLHSTESSDTNSTKSSRHDHDRKSLASPITSSLRLLRRSRSSSISHTPPPPVPPIPPVNDQLPPPIKRSNSYKTRSKPAVLVRSRSRPSLDSERHETPVPGHSHTLLNDSAYPPMPTRLQLDIPPSRRSMSRDPSSGSSSSATMTPAVTPVQKTGVAFERTDTVDSTVSSLLEFADPVPVTGMAKAAAKYQSTLGQDIEADVREGNKDWTMEEDRPVKLKRSGSLSKLAKTLGFGVSDMPPPPPRLPLSPPIAAPLAHPPIPMRPSATLPPIRPPRSPARLTKQVGHSRRWSISSFASSTNSENHDSELMTTQSEAHGVSRALPIPQNFFVKDAAVEPERTSAVLRAEYLPSAQIPKSARGADQSWYGEWNRRDIRDVISSLRELR